jgi:coenzyme F420-0:L-glutamate ligase / coenzyme F420-1:gamma-L-glutamate ligase
MASNILAFASPESASLNSPIPSFTVKALPGIPLIQSGDDLAQLILDSLNRAGLVLQTGDALVVTSKIVSKAEGRQFDLREIAPGEEAQNLADETRKDPRIVELVLRESRLISRKAPGVLVVQHRLGFVSANAGIDQSNVEGGDDHVLLLPLDPDASAESLRQKLRAVTGADVGIVISDSHGRPFRIGNVGVAIGVAGMPALLDLRGRPDLFGRELKISIQGYADLVASAANLLTGEADEGRPVVHLRGLQFPPMEGRAHEMIRSPEQDLYR